MPSPPKTSNESDPRITAKVFLIRDHYEAIHKELKWNRERCFRLCSALGVTPYELGAAIRASVSEVERWLDRNSFNKMAELHLTMIERAAYRDFHKQPLLPPCFLTSTS